MGAVYNRYTITAAGKYLLAPAGAGMGAGGWQVSVSGTFVASGTLKQATSAPGSTLTLGSAITYYDVTTLASSTAAITAAASVVVPDTGSDLYLDVTSYTSGAVVVLVSAAGEEIGSTEGNLTAFDPTFFGTLASAAGPVALGASPPTTGGVRVDAASYSGSVAFAAVNGTTNGIAINCDYGAQVLGTTTSRGLYLGSRSLLKWLIDPDAAGTSTLTSQSATTRIVGGSNGLAIRNSGNTRDNAVFVDNGSELTLYDGTYSARLNISAASGEMPSGICYGGGSSSSATLASLGGGANLKATMCYFNGTQWYTAAEIANVASGLGTLALMKSGGAIARWGSAGGNASSAIAIRKAVTAIANATATTVFTVTIPNAAHSAAVKVTLVGSLGAGGAIGANEATGTIAYDLSIARTAGVAAVTTLSAAYGSATSQVAGAATITVAGTATAMAGAVGATQTFDIQVTITRGSGASANHTCLAIAEVINANATGITIA